MSQRSSEWADAAALGNEGSCIDHVRYVRLERTPVKTLDNVPTFYDYTYMTDQQKIGEILLELKDRSGLSLEEIALASDYAGKSSVQEYFKPTFEGPLGRGAAIKLARGLAGRGSPPIVADEILNLGPDAASNASRPLHFEGSSSNVMERNLPIYGTALGASALFEGEAVEQTTLNRGEIIDYVERPQMLNGKKNVYGLHVQGISMEPVYEHGDLLIVMKDAPYRSGEDVVVYLRNHEVDDGETAEKVLVKRFVRRTADYWELAQFEPKRTFRLAAADVLRADKVLKLRDLLS